MNIPIYEAIFNEENEKGVYALSVVENPAMEDLWIALSEQPKEIELSAVDDKKRLLLGAALIPNKKVYRNIDGNEFYLTFTEDTIEKLAHNFQKQSAQNNSSLEHDVKLEGMSIVETWTVQDPNNDKSNAFGKTYEKGTWVTMMKVDNDEMWQKALKGEIKGFSIDGLLGLQKVNFKNDINMNVDLKSITDAIKDGFNTLLNKEEVEKVEVATEEVVAEVTEEVEAPAFDVEAFKKDLTEVLAQFSGDIDKKIEAVKVEFSSKNEKLETEKKDLEVELSKEPEVDAIKLGKDNAYANVELNAKGRILTQMRNN